MRDDLGDVVYESPWEESDRVPPTDRRPRRPSLGERLAGPVRMPAVVFLGICVLLAVQAVMLASPADRATTSDEDLAAQDGGLLADLRGDDVIHRLVVTQASLKREMALLREAASRGGAPLPDDVETTFALAAHAAELERLGALVKKLEADQGRLHGLAAVSQAGIAILERHVKELEQRLEDRAAGERN